MPSLGLGSEAERALRGHLTTLLRLRDLGNLTSVPQFPHWFTRHITAPPLMGCYEDIALSKGYDYYYFAIIIIILCEETQGPPKNEGACSTQTQGKLETWGWTPGLLMPLQCFPRSHLQHKGVSTGWLCHRPPIEPWASFFTAWSLSSPSGGWRYNDLSRGELYGLNGTVHTEPSAWEVGSTPYTLITTSLLS